MTVHVLWDVAELPLTLISLIYSNLTLPYLIKCPNPAEVFHKILALGVILSAKCHIQKLPNDPILMVMLILNKCQLQLQKKFKIIILQDRMLL